MSQVLKISNYKIDINLKKGCFVILFMSILASVYSQKYDLIVSIKGDSIACSIDSITGTAVFFKMKNNYKWIQTHISKDEIIEYKYNAIHKYKVVFLRGTSYIDKFFNEPDPNKKGELEIGFGINLLGPVHQMANLMEEYGFNESYTSMGFLLEFPNYNEEGFTMHFSYNKYIGFRSQVGIILYYSILNKVRGHSGGAYSPREDLDIEFKNFSIIPLYSFELKPYCEFDVGPALMINSGNDVYYSSEGSNYTKASIGLLTGLNIKIWNGKTTFGKIGTYYLLTTSSKMGPYSTIPESKINFSYLNIFLAFGFNL